MMRTHETRSSIIVSLGGSVYENQSQVTCPRRPHGDQLPVGVTPVLGSGPPWVAERLVDLCELGSDRTADATAEASGEKEDLESLVMDMEVLRRISGTEANIQAKQAKLQELRAKLLAEKPGV